MMRIRMPAIRDTMGAVVTWMCMDASVDLLDKSRSESVDASDRNVKLGRRITRNQRPRWRPTEAKLVRFGPEPLVGQHCQPNTAPMTVLRSSRRQVPFLSRH